MRHLTSRVRRGAIVALVGVAAAGCFAGYDSRWLQQKGSQQRNAAHLTPAALSAEPRSPGRLRTLRARVYTSPRYLAQTVDPQKQIDDLMENGSRILATSVGARLEVESVRPFEPGAEDDLSALVDALEAKDRGDDVDFVVAMIGGMPTVTRSFHQLGIGRVLGKHLVVRAAGQVGEYDAIEGAFGRLSEEERTRLRKERKQHRAVAVFLHELGHTLGALHERGDRERPSLMAPEYDVRMASFGAASTGLMRITLEHRADPPALARELLAYIEGGAITAWSEEDRAGMVARLRSSLPKPPVTAIVAPAPAPPPREDADPRRDLRALSDADRQTYARAQEELLASRSQKAWETARHLFATYPDVFAVQNFRCELAALRYLEPPELRAECEPAKRAGDRLRAAGK